MKVENDVITLTKDELRKVQDQWLSVDRRVEGQEVYDMDLPDFIEWASASERWAES